MLKRLFNLVRLTLVAALLLAALVLTAARLWVPSLSEYRNDIVAAAATALNRPVNIRRMEATWRGLSPVLKLKDVTIGGAPAMPERLDIREIWIRIDMRHLLARRAMRIGGVDIIGVDLTLTRDAQGHVYIAELPQDARSGAGDFSLADLSHFSLHDASVTLHNMPGLREPQRLRDVTLSLQTRGSRHAISGYALLPDTLGERIEIEAQLRGRSHNPLRWQGLAYFRGKALVMSTLLQDIMPELLVASGRTDMRVWASLGDGRLDSLAGEVEIEDVTAQYGSGSSEGRFDADTLSTRFGWRQVESGWQLALQDLRFSRESSSWQAENLSVAVSKQQAVRHMSANLSQLDLQVLAGLLTVLPLEDRYRVQVLALRPVGLVHGLTARLRQEDGTIRLDRFDARFSKLGVGQGGDMFAVAGLDGAIRGSADAGTLTLDSHVVELQDERLFRAALHFDRLYGDLHWQDTGAGLQLSGHGLSAGNDHLAMQGDLVLMLPHDSEAVSVDLQLDIPRMEVARVHDYLPARVMSPVGVAWLDRSLAGGDVQDGTVLLQGRLDQFPFDNGEGRFEVRLPVTGATLDFDAHWSPVQQLDAQVDFTGRQMDIHSRAGNIRTASLHGVHAQIRDLAKPRLTLKGDVKGELPVMLAELGSSPLGESYGGLVDRIETTGTAELALDIVVPLEGDDAPISVAGRIGLNGNTLNIRESDIKLGKIRGSLRFDDVGIQGDGLQATLFDKPVQAKVWTEDPAGVTNIELRGRLALLDQVLAPDHTLRQAVRDDSDWRVRLSTRGKPVRGKASDLALSLHSTLADTVIDLPAPLGKPRDSERELSIRVDGLEQQQSKLQFSYGDVLQGRLLIEQQGKLAARLKRGVIALGASEPVLPESDVLLIRGRLERFSLADWQPYFRAGGDGPDLPLQLSVAVAELELPGHVLRDADLDIRSAGREWTVRGNSESLRGEARVTYSADGVEQVVMDLERVAVATLEQAAEPRPAAALRPGDIPDLQVTARQLLYNGVDYGSLDLLAQKLPDGRLQIERLAMSSDMLTLRMSGDWHVEGDRTFTTVDVSVSDGRMDRLLDVLGYQKVIKGGVLTGSMQAGWQGAPWKLERGSLDGRIKLIIKDGQLLEVDPGAGRVLGLLSVSMLPRRLTLDFSDLFGEGFSFNRIGGSFVLDAGSAYTNDLEIDGPAAKVEISGRVGLVAQDYDELVTVTPYLQSSLPLAGAIAGGPAGVAAAIVAEKLFEGTLGLNEMARKQYTVTGSWSEPVVSRLTAPEPEAGSGAGTTGGNP